MIYLIFTSVNIVGIIHAAATSISGFVVAVAAVDFDDGDNDGNTASVTIILS